MKLIQWNSTGRKIEKLRWKNSLMVDVCWTLYKLWNTLQSISVKLQTKI